MKKKIGKEKKQKEDIIVLTRSQFERVLMVYEAGVKIGISNNRLASNAFFEMYKKKML